MLWARPASPKADPSGPVEEFPDTARWHETGRAQFEAGDLPAALKCFERITELKNDDVAAWLQQAELYRELDRGEDAADAFQTALLFAPHSVAALVGLARLTRDGASAQSVDYLRRALQVEPLNPVLHFDYALSLNRDGDTAAAEAAYARAIELDSRYVAALINLGLLFLLQKGDAPRAQSLFERAVALEPEMVAAQANLGLALQEQGKFDAAYAHYDRLIGSHPDTTEYRWNRALARLSQGDFARGWDDYELRNRRGGGSGSRQFPFSEWDGGALAGHDLLVYGEQGLGDEIMFASCIPDVVAKARSVVVECSAPLEALFRRSFPQASVHGALRDGNRSWLKNFPQLDRQISIASLPRFVRRHRTQFPPHNGYLVAEPERVRYWQTRLAALGSRPRIGISWRGGTRKTRAETRSMRLADCMPLFLETECEFICLQNAEHADEIATLNRAGDRVHQWPEVIQSTDELAALVSALDLIIAVPSTVVHVSGALGKNVWVMLSTNPEWRYLWQGDRMPWYPSARLFRQDGPRGWASVVAEILRTLGAAREQNAPR